MYQTDVEILACIDALKIIYALSSDQFEMPDGEQEKIDRLSQIPDQFTFQGGEKVKQKENASTQSSKMKKSCCFIYSLHRVQYQNPLLNNIHLQKQLSAMTKLTISKVLKYSFKLQEMGYNISYLDLESTACLIISLG